MFLSNNINGEICYGRLYKLALIVPSLPLLATYHDDSFGVGVYPVFLRPTSSHYPCYLVTVDEQELSLLIKEVHLLVGHVVAEELASAAHAKGSEGVACQGCAHGQLP